MATFSGTKALPNGLVLALDAANPASYPGTGTIFYDLSGKKNNGTFNGSVSYSSDNYGILTTPGSSGTYISIPGPNLSTTNHTIIGATRYAPGWTGGGRIISSYSNNFLLGHHGSNQSNCGDYYTEGWVNNPSSGGGGNDWHIYTAKGDYSGDTWTVLRDNGQLASNNSGSQGPNGFELGRWRSNSEYSQAHISFLFAWDRVLSNAEITQVYNSMKYRFGLS